MIVTFAYPFIDGRAIIWIKDTNSPDNYSRCTEKCGLINATGEFVIPPIYDSMQYARGTNVIVNIGFEDHETSQVSGKWGVIDLNNHILIPLKYSEIYPWKNGLYAVEFQEKWGVINQSDKIIIPFEYDWISWPAQDQYGWIHAEIQGKYGCITIEGKVVIPFIYDEIILMENDELIPVKYGDQAYYIDRNGHRTLF